MYSSNEYQKVAKENIEYLDILFQTNKKKKSSYIKKIFYRFYHP